jgi:branched-chain amino acid transport system ATP-binding protein
MKPYQRARIGIGRTFQITNLFPHLSVADHLRLCGANVLGERLSFVRSAGRIPAIESFVEEALGTSELSDLREVAVRNLSYGHQRQLEVVMAVSTQPRLLLMDEPAAGLSAAEVGPIVNTIRGLDRSITVVIVEHDMDVAFAVADRIIVFNHGELVASGTPADIRENEEVRRIYLGRHQ